MVSFCLFLYLRGERRNWSLEGASLFWRLDILHIPHMIHYLGLHITSFIDIVIKCQMLEVGDKSMSLWTGFVSPLLSRACAFLRRYIIIPTMITIRKANASTPNTTATTSPVDKPTKHTDNLSNMLVMCTPNFLNLKRNCKFILYLEIPYFLLSPWGLLVFRLLEL